MYKKLPEEDATPSETINSVTFSNMYVDLASANGFEGYSGENVFWLTADITSSQQTDIRSIVLNAGTTMAITF
jgi:hypothetical protein